MPGINRNSSKSPACTGEIKFSCWCKGWRPRPRPVQRSDMDWTRMAMAWRTVRTYTRLLGETKQVWRYMGSRSLEIYKKGLQVGSGPLEIMPQYLPAVFFKHRIITGRIQRIIIRNAAQFFSFIISENNQWNRGEIENIFHCFDPFFCNNKLPPG